MIILILLCLDLSVRAIPQFTTEFGACGTSAFGKTCSPGFCCSIHGYCGNSKEYCLPEQGCQAGFGECLGLELAIATLQSQPTAQPQSLQSQSQQPELQQNTIVPLNNSELSSFQISTSIIIEDITTSSIQSENTETVIQTSPSPPPLSENNTGSSSDQSDLSQQFWIIISISITGLLLAAILTLYLYTRKRRKVKNFLNSNDMSGSGFKKSIVSDDRIAVPLVIIHQDSFMNNAVDKMAVPVSTVAFDETMSAESIFSPEPPVLDFSRNLETMIEEESIEQSPENKHGDDGIASAGNSSPETKDKIDSKSVESDKDNPDLNETAPKRMGGFFDFPDNETTNSNPSPLDEEASRMENEHGHEKYSSIVSSHSKDQDDIQQNQATLDKPEVEYPWTTTKSNPGFENELDQSQYSQQQIDRRSAQIAAKICKLFLSINSMISTLDTQEEIDSWGDKLRDEGYSEEDILQWQSQQTICTEDQIYEWYCSTHSGSGEQQILDSHNQ